jgi:hypothetical protein
MLEGKTDKYVVECTLAEGQVTDIRLPERDIGQSLSQYQLAGLCKRLSRNIDRDEVRMGTVAGKEPGLGSDAATRFENYAAIRVPGAFMEEETEPGCLVK